jgi:hypothetical protein
MSLVQNVLRVHSSIELPIGAISLKLTATVTGGKIKKSVKRIKAV